MNGITIHQGDVREVLKSLPDESVHCVVTSPPYWGLRDYGVAGQLGLERTPYEYVSAMVDIFHEVQRVLRSDGTVWLNLGDCYATGAGAVGECGKPQREYAGKGPRRQIPSHVGKHTAIVAIGPMTQPNRMPIAGLKPKDLVGIPWRVAFALQSDGWWLRSDIVWSKPNPMPESVADRPTKSHEYLFLLTKAERYHYDAKAIAEPTVSTHIFSFTDATDKQRGHGRRHAGFNGRYAEKLKAEGLPAERNKRSVWTVCTKPFPEAHFATFPEELIRPCILAGCPPGGTVLDPFFGSGTTGLVARAQGCKCIGIELNPEYIKIAERRLAQEHLEFANEPTVALSTCATE